MMKKHYVFNAKDEDREKALPYLNKFLKSEKFKKCTSYSIKGVYDDEGNAYLYYLNNCAKENSPRILVNMETGVCRIVEETLLNKK